jgi:hypothetical protein
MITFMKAPISSRTHKLNITLYCGHCGTPFHPKQTREKTAKWCSIRCCGEGRKRTDEEFWDHFDGLTDKLCATGCWEWRGQLTPDGYGNIQRGGKPRRVHRLSYERHVGKIPGKALVCHRCDNRKCLNPAHLFLGDNKANMADMARKGRHRFGIANNGYKKRNLTPEQIVKIRADERTQREIAAEFGVSQSQIFLIKHRISYANVP